MLDENELNDRVTVWRDAARKVRREHGVRLEACRRYLIFRSMIDGQVRDVVLKTETLIARAGVQSSNEVRLHSRPLVQYSPPRRKLNQEMRKYLFKNLHFSQ